MSAAMAAASGAAAATQVGNFSLYYVSGMSIFVQAELSDIVGQLRESVATAEAALLASRETAAKQSSVC
jgi:hypothetical protein